MQFWLKGVALWSGVKNVVHSEPFLKKGCTNKNAGDKNLTSSLTPVC